MSMIGKFTEKFGIQQGRAALVLSEQNRLYLTGIESSDGAVLITPCNAYLIVDFRYYEMAKSNSDGFSVVLAERSLLECAQSLCEKENISTLSIEDDYVTVSLNNRIQRIFQNVQVEYLGSLISEMRSVKTESEIQKIINAQELTDAAYTHILEYLKPGLTEKDVASEIDFFMQKNGAQSTAFKTICVSGRNSSLPHGEPAKVQLSPNSFLTMDFGAKLDGYCSDMTRTVVIGRADSEMKFIYNTVLEAQLAALEVIHANVLGCDVDAAARNIIRSKGFGNNFGHSTGHGLGIDVHEHPSFSPNYKKEIPLNSILSVEPGIYIEGKYGVRIEDIVVVGEKSAINLTKSDKKLIEI